MNACLFLSNSNFILMQEIRQIAKKNNVEIFPCKYIFEVLEKNELTYNAVLVENVNLSNGLENLKNRVFYIKDKNVCGLSSPIKFDCFESFFKSGIFKNSVQSSLKQEYDEMVNQKLLSLGVVFNTWQSRILKEIILDMKKMNIQNANRKFIDTEKAKYNLANINFCNSLRPLLKEISKTLKEKQNIKVGNSIYEIIDSLYLHIFKEIG